MSRRIPWLVALLCVAAGIGWVTATGLNAGKQMATLESQGKRLVQLTQLQAVAGQTHAARTHVERSMKDRPPGLRELVDIYLPGMTLQVQAVEGETLAEGWRIEREVLRFEKLTGGQIGLIMQKAEGQRPPLRLEGLELEPGADDQMRGELRFQSLRKKSSGI